MKERLFEALLNDMLGETSSSPCTLDAINAQLEENTMPICLFNIGDVVTPIKNSQYRFRGRIHKVVRSFAVPKLSSVLGVPARFFNMTVATIARDGELVFYNVVSDQFELYKEGYNYDEEDD